MRTEPAHWRGHPQWRSGLHGGHSALHGGHSALHGDTETRHGMHTFQPHALPARRCGPACAHGCSASGPCLLQEPARGPGPACSESARNRAQCGADAECGAAHCTQGGAQADSMATLRKVALCSTSDMRKPCHPPLRLCLLCLRACATMPSPPLRALCVCPYIDLLTDCFD